MAKGSNFLEWAEVELLRPGGRVLEDAACQRSSGDASVLSRAIFSELFEGIPGNSDRNPIAFVAPSDDDCANVMPCGPNLPPVLCEIMRQARLARAEMASPACREANPRP